MKSLCVVLAIVFAISVKAAPREKRQLFGGTLGGFLGDGGYHHGAFETLNLKIKRGPKIMNQQVTHTAGTLATTSTTQATEMITADTAKDFADTANLAEALTKDFNSLNTRLNSYAVI
jgi:hypothetical protein